MVVASLSLGTRIVTELTVLELRGHAYGCGKARTRRTIEGRDYDCCALVIQDRIELAYFGQLRKDSAISTIKRAAIDSE